jgi:hypothetical protein
MGDNVEGVFVPIKRESPAGRQHLHNLTAGAWLPIVQSFFTGFVSGMLTLVIASVLRARSPWNWVAGVFAVAWALAWFQHEKHWFSLTALEQVTGIDLNRDGVIGAPQSVPEERIIHVHMDEIKGGSYSQTRFDLPASESQMEELAIGILLQGKSFSHRKWTVGKDAPFSDDEFRKLRREFIQRELVQVAKGSNASQGFILTAAGEKLLKEFLPEAPSPTGELV